MMRNKKYIGSIIRIIIFLILVVLLISGLNYLLIRKDEYSKYRQFYSEEENFDVLFFGSSRMLDCIQPMELWKDYGITSYNMAQHSEGMGRSYYSMLNAFKYNEPKVAVIDVSLFYGAIGLSEEASESDKAYLHNTLDHMPFSNVKIKAIEDLVPKVYRFEYYFTLAKYHSRWNEINQNDIYISHSARKGAEVRTNIEPQERMEWPTDELAEVFIPENINLDKMIELCEQEGIIPVFICLPSPVDRGVASYNSFSKYFEEHNITFLNIYKEEDFLNYETDFADTSHLNVSGSIKVTDYMGKYLCENYFFPEKTDETKSKWNNELKNYWATKNVLLISEESNYDSVMAMIVADSDYDYELTGGLNKRLRVTNNRTGELLIDRDYSD